MSTGWRITNAIIALCVVASFSALVNPYLGGAILAIAALSYIIILAIDHNRRS